MQTTIKIGEKEYNASLNFGAIKLIQAKTGKTLDKAFEAISSMDFDIISIIIFACIYTHNKKFKMEEIDALSYSEVIEVIGSLKEVIEASMPKATGKK